MDLGLSPGQHVDLAASLSYQPGIGVFGDQPPVDNDPDPLHLIDLTNIPGGAAYNYLEYSYTLTYDLRLVPGSRHPELEAEDRT